MTLIRFLPVALLLLCCGCGSSDNRQALSGTVEFQGETLPQGSIEFVARDGSSQTGTTIQDGAFTIPASQGLPPGSYVVRIYSASET